MMGVGGMKEGNHHAEKKGLTASGGRDVAHVWHNAVKE